MGLEVLLAGGNELDGSKLEAVERASSVSSHLGDMDMLGSQHTHGSRSER